MHLVVDIFDRILDMVCELNGKKYICIFGNAITIQIILRNEIPGNNDLFIVTSTEKYGYQIKKSSISKSNVACSNTNHGTQTYS